MSTYNNKVSDATRNDDDDVFRDDEIPQDQDAVVNSSSSFNINNEEEELYYASNVRQVVLSKFVITQVIINTLGSFIGPLITFYCLFGLLSQGPYVWNGSQLVGVVVGSLVGSPLFIFALMPIGIPEALKNGWFYKLRVKDVHPKWLLCVLPFLRDDKRIWRYSTIRNCMLGLICGIIYVPLAILIARYGVGPTLTTWELIFFNVIYLVCLAPPITIFGLVGYAMEQNINVIVAKMNNDPNPLKRVLRRIVVSIGMTLCCRES
ncbi:hypothetical protein ACHAWC_006019 [Mediolabrus comicus]